jgi:hypothetical protein
MRIKPLDSIAVIGVPLAVVGMIADNTLAVGLAFAASSLLMCIAIINHAELGRGLRAVVSLAVILGFGTAYTVVANRNQEADLAKNTGDLSPSADADGAYALPGCRVPEGALRVLAGNSLVWSTVFPMNVMSVAGRIALKIDKGRNGALSITTLEVFDDRHVNIASVDNNKLWVEPSSRRERPDPSTLRVFDHNNDKILDLRFANATLLVITGVFRTPNGGKIIIDPGLIRIGGMYLNSTCSGNNNIAFAF